MSIPTVSATSPLPRLPLRATAGNPLVQQFIRMSVKPAAQALVRLLQQLAGLVTQDQNGGYSAGMQDGDGAPSQITPAQLQAFMAVPSFLVAWTGVKTQVGLMALLQEIVNAEAPFLPPGGTPATVSVPTGGTPVTTATTIGALIDQIVAM